jgi:hypothetical protein
MISLGNVSSGQKSPASTLFSASPSSAFRLKWRPSAILALLWLFLIPLISPSILHAEVRCFPPACQEELAFYWGSMPLYQFPSKLDGGGTLSVFTVMTSAGLNKQVTERLGAGIGFSYTYDSYDFSGLTAFRVPRPWSSIHTFAVEVPLSYFVTDKWKLNLVPAGQFSGEMGANFGESLAYGSVMAVSYVFGPQLELGGGVGVYYNLETVTVYPYIILKYHLSDRVAVSTPFPGGPAGPAGFEISYNLNDHWGIGVGGAYRAPRFRLERNGPLPNGVGEHRSIPIFARLSYVHSKAFKIDFYGGASFFNEVKIDNSEGDEIYRTQQYVSPLLALMISGTL